MEKTTRTPRETITALARAAMEDITIGQDKNCRILVGAAAYMATQVLAANPEPVADAEKLNEGIRVVREWVDEGNKDAGHKTADKPGTDKTSQQVPIADRLQSLTHEIGTRTDRKKHVVSIVYNLISDTAILAGKIDRSSIKKGAVLSLGTTVSMMGPLLLKQWAGEEALPLIADINMVIDQMVESM